MEESKFLLTIEFRYNDAPIEMTYESSTFYRTKKVTLGIFDHIEQAIFEGNIHLQYLESRFELNPNWNRRQRFSLDGGAYGSKKLLISNLGYLVTPFEFFMKITELRQADLPTTVTAVMDGILRYETLEKYNKQ